MNGRDGAAGSEGVCNLPPITLPAGTDVRFGLVLVRATYLEDGRVVFSVEAPE